MTDARILRSQAGLRQALLQLLETTPFEEVTIRDIAASANVGYTTYFRHYGSKEALLAELAADEVGRLSEFTLSIYEVADSRAACAALCDYVDRHRTLWSALLTGAPNFVREEMFRRARQDSAGRGGGWLPGDLATVLTVTGIVELLAWWLRQSAPPSAEFMAEVLDRAVIAPAHASA